MASHLVLRRDGFLIESVTRQVAGHIMEAFWVHIKKTHVNAERGRWNIDHPTSNEKPGSVNCRRGNFRCRGIGRSSSVSMNGNSLRLDSSQPGELLNSRFNIRADLRNDFLAGLNE